MVLLLALVLAVVWGLVRGGRLTRVLELPLRGYGLILLAFGLQVAIVYVPMPPGWGGLHVPLLSVSYAILAVFVFWNRRLPGMWLIGAGLLANALVMIANGGYMPITPEALLATGRGNLATSMTTGARVLGSKDILLPAEQTRLWLLSDIFVLPPPFPIPSVFSIGDALLALGIFRLVPYALGARPRDQKITLTEST